MAEQIIPYFIVPALEQIVDSVGLTPLLHLNFETLLGQVLSGTPVALALG